MRERAEAKARADGIVDRWADDWDLDGATWIQRLAYLRVAIEAALLAAHRAGQEAMREKAAKVADEWSNGSATALAIRLLSTEDEHGE